MRYWLSGNQMAGLKPISTIECFRYEANLKVKQLLSDCRKREPATGIAFCLSFDFKERPMLW